MAAGIFAVLDDIAMLMDDVVMMSKIATKKTAGILGDDLAVNAEKATGFVSSRELPVLWAITKGSFVNKLIILPVVFVLSYFLPIVIKYILILGGLYLAYEGAHKIYEWIFYSKTKQIDIPIEKIDIVDNEKDKVKSAVTTDFILSLEIVIIAMGTVVGKSLQIQIITVSVVALLATVGVYGLVALIVRMDDFGFMLINKSKGNKALMALGNGFIRLLPMVIRTLGFVGTLALILVSGGIFMHNIEAVHHLMPATWPSYITEFIVGLVGGFLVLVVLSTIEIVIKKLRRSS